MNNVTARTQTEQSAVVLNLLLDAAAQSEKAIAYARTTIVVLMLIRFVILDPPFSAYLIAVPAAAVAIGFSVLYLVWHRSRGVRQAWFWWSVFIDATVSCAILMNNVFNPWPEYPGSLLIPDTAILLIIVFSTGFRLSTQLALFGGLVNGLSLILVIVFDQALNAEQILYDGSHITMWMIMLLGATFAAMISAWRTRTLSLQGAHESIRLERVRTGMKTLLQSHHDAHSLLSSLYMNAEQLVKRTRHLDKSTQSLADYFMDDLQAMKSCVQQLKHSADGHFNASLQLNQVELGAAIDHLVTKMQHQIPDLKIQFHPTDEPHQVQIAGGAHSLSRILVNLLNNAREGDGQRGAKSVEITLEKTPDSVIFHGFR